MGLTWDGLSQGRASAPPHGPSPATAKNAVLRDTGIDQSGGAGAPASPPAEATVSLRERSSLRSQLTTFLRTRRFGLSTKLLALTAVFVMLAEVLIFVPSIANYRVQWLSDRLTVARLAALAAEAFPGGEMPDGMRDELLTAAQVRMVAIKRAERRSLVVREDETFDVAASYDLRTAQNIMPSSPWDWLQTRAGLIADAVTVFFTRDERLIRVVGQPNMTGNDYIEIVLAQGPLRKAMIRHGLNILALSIVISVVAGTLVYIALNSLFVRPLTRITRNMEHFSADPEDASRVITPSTRTDEIGTAERELAHMQSELNQLLAQKNRLAALGLAVSKINHDMRNMLANVQLLSDNLTSVNDPRVQRFAPKLIASLDRAIAFCNDTLRFGRAAEPPPRRELFLLRPLIEEVGESQGLPRLNADPRIDWKIEIDPALRLDGDKDQLYRVFSNLVRNSLQAIESRAPARNGAIAIKAVRSGPRVVVDITDTGPGLPARARTYLFQAFQSSTRRGGSGLGLAIAHELVTAHGGSIRLVESDATPDPESPGTHFRLEFTDRIPPQ